MKAHQYVMSKAGNLDHLQLQEVVLPEPEHTEVLIAVRSIGLNFADVFAVLGMYSATPKGSFVPGLEFAGVVIEVGNAVSKLKVGDRIMGVTRFGAYGTHLIIDQNYVTPIPPAWSFQEGAAYLVQAITAYYGLVNLGNIQPGHKVLIHSAAGGVGLLANRLVKYFKGYTIGTIGYADKLDLLLREGYDHVIVRGSDFDEQLTGCLNGEQLDLIMECIGGKVMRIGLSHLAPMGRMIIYGSARYANPGKRPNWLHIAKKHLFRPKIDPQELISANHSLMGFNLIWLYDQKELFAALIRKLEAIDLGKPHIGAEFDFEDLKKAIAYLQSGKSVGKVVVNC